MKKYKTTVEILRDAGYPLRIIGNGGYKATLRGVQPLIGGYAAIYRYQGGEAVHSLEEIMTYFTVLEW